MLSLLLSISYRSLVPRMFLRVVWASSRVLEWASSTLATLTVALLTLQSRPGRTRFLGKKFFKIIFLSPRMVGNLMIMFDLINPVLFYKETFRYKKGSLI